MVRNMVPTRSMLVHCKRGPAAAKHRSWHTTWGQVSQCERGFHRSTVGGYLDIRAGFRMHILMRKWRWGCTISKLGGGVGAYWFLQV